MAYDLQQSSEPCLVCFHSGCHNQSHISFATIQILLSDVDNYKMGIKRTIHKTVAKIIIVDRLI